MFNRSGDLADHLDYYGDDEGTRQLIARVVLQLPSDVAEFTLDRCRFLSIGESCYGMTLPGRIGTHWLDDNSSNVWLILLVENLDRLPGEDARSIIAHEIAHAWLGHDRTAPESEDFRTDAARLTQQWGFYGKGSDPDYCRAPAKE